MNQPPKPPRPNLRQRIDLLAAVVIVLIVLGAVIFRVGYTLPSPLLQALGAITFGAGLSALIGALSGRQAIHQQSAKEANLTRKRETYGPLYAELKSLRIALMDARAGKAPAPQWIDNGTDTNLGDILYFPSAADGPALTCWPEFRRDYRDTDFSLPTQNLLDGIQALATTYNQAVEDARHAAVPILTTYIEAAIAAEQQSTAYHRWKQQQAAHNASQGMAGHKLVTKYDWFGHFDDGAIGRIVAVQWLTLWPAGGAPHRSLAMGWLLASNPDEAAIYVQRNYPTQAATFPPPLLDWIQRIFSEAWPTLEQDPKLRAATEARDTLFQHVQTAETTLADGLRRIQRMYEGGEPLV